MIVVFLVAGVVGVVVTGVVGVVVSIAFATSVSDEVEVVDVGKATASSQAQWEILVYKDQLVSK